MLYNLRNGSTISLSVDRYLDMSDEDLEKLELYYRGAEINDPFFGSILEGRPRDEPEVIPNEDILSVDIVIEAPEEE
jgi:hypothetical protein